MISVDSPIDSMEQQQPHFSSDKLSKKYVYIYICKIYLMLLLILFKLFVYCQLASPRKKNAVILHTIQTNDC